MNRDDFITWNEIRSFIEDSLKFVSALTSYIVAKLIIYYINQVLLISS